MKNMAFKFLNNIKRIAFKKLMVLFKLDHSKMPVGNQPNKLGKKYVIINY